MTRTPLAEPIPSKGILLDVARSVDDVGFDGSRVDIVSFTWRISNSLALGRRITLRRSSLVDAHVKGRQCRQLVSVFGCSRCSQLPLEWSRCLKFSLTVFNQLQPRQSITRETKQVFSKEVSNCGFTSLIPLDELHDRSKGFLVNDTCIIKANVAVCMAQIMISKDQKPGSSTLKPVEYLNQGHKEQGILLKL